MSKLKSDTVPKLAPIDFDANFFSSDWRPQNFGFYDRFHIERVETYKNHLNLPLPPHRRSVHYFMFLNRGTAIRNKGLSRYEIKSNQFFFLSAEQISNIEFISDNATGYYCHFQPDIFLHPNLKIDLDKDFSFFQSKSDPIVEIRELDRILELLNLLDKEYILSQKNRFHLIPIYLLALFSEVKQSSLLIENSSSNAASYITFRYKNALSEFIYTKKSIQEFADYLSVSANHLHKCVKATTGKSAHDLLNEMRILEAKVLLRQTNMTIGEIAFKIGQFESSDFGKIFKKNTGISPRQYRAMYI